jgi:hypothetical protein
MSEKVFAEGIFFDKAREGAPEFVKGSVSFRVDDAVKFLQTHKSEKGYVNLDLLKSKGGKLYLALNTWTPEKKEEPAVDPSTDTPF